MITAHLAVSMHQKRPAGVRLVFSVYILGMVERKLTNNRGVGQLSLPGMSMKKLCFSYVIRIAGKCDKSVDFSLKKHKVS